MKELFLIISWVSLFYCFLVIIGKIYLQKKYIGSIEEKLDNLNGVQGDYMKYFNYYVIILLVSMCYLFWYFIYGK